MPSLQDTVAVVTGASRGGGRGIALALGDAGATVYVTGRSIRGDRTTDKVPGTIEDTAEEVTARGGRGIPVRCDHTVPDLVEALFTRVQKEQGRLDVLVNNAWGGNALPITGDPFWEQPLEHWDNMFNAGVFCHVLSSRFGVQLMLGQGHGLIVNTTAWAQGKYTGNFFYDLAKNAMNRMAFDMAEELRPHGIAALAVAPGWMRTELVLAAYDTDEAHWRANEALSRTESPEYVGRAVAALAADPDVMEKTGRVMTAGGLAREYGFTDVDGTQPEPFQL